MLTKENLTKDLYKESIFKANGINEDFDQNAMRSNHWLFSYIKKRNEREFSREFIIIAAFYYIGNKWEDKLEFANSVLKVYSYIDIYARSPEELAAYMCLKKSKEYNDFLSCIKYIMTSVEKEIPLRETVTYGWLKRKIDEQREEGFTKHITQQIRSGVNDIVLGNEDIIEMLKKTLERYNSFFSANRTSATFYFQKYVYSIINFYLYDFDTRVKEYCEDKTNKSKREKVDEWITDCPFIGKIEITIKSEEEKRYLSSIGQKGYRIQQTFIEKFVETRLNLAKLSKICIMNALGYEYKKWYENYMDCFEEEQEQYEIVKELKGDTSREKWFANMMCGNNDVTRAWLCIAFVAEQYWKEKKYISNRERFVEERMNELNRVLLYCGFKEIQSTGGEIVDTFVCNRMQGVVGANISDILYERPNNFTRVGTEKFLETVIKTF